MSSTQSRLKRIILTTKPLSSEGEKLAANVTQDGYEVLLPTDLKSNDDDNRVEIILLDSARPDQMHILSSENLARFPNLKLIQSTRAGVDALRFEDISQNVQVCGNVGAYGDQIAEHVFGMILYFARNLGVSNQELARGAWQIPQSIFLKGKTILVLGAGGIGEPVARVASTLGMKTIGLNTSGRPVPNFEHVVPLDRLDEVLKIADVIVIALPLTVKTFHLIDESKLSIMKPAAILVNVARGHIISEKALFEHLKDNPDFKCGLDVWWHYPKRGETFAQRFPFFELSNVLGTPHDSGIVPETDEIALLSSIENIGRFVRSEPLRGLMNRNDYLGLKELIARAE